MTDKYYYIEAEYPDMTSQVEYISDEVLTCIRKAWEFAAMRGVETAIVVYGWPTGTTYCTVDAENVKFLLGVYKAAHGESND